MEKHNTLKKAIGIISWLPDNIADRQKRQDRFVSLIERISNLLPNIDIIIIAQNWKGFSPTSHNNNIIIFSYNMALGILKARQTLREEFLKGDYEYIIMFDDDAMPIEEVAGSVNLYLQKIDENPCGFAFVKSQIPTNNPYNAYAFSQLNFCAISRYIYMREPIPQIDASKNEGYEDNIYSTLLHYKYQDLEFAVPRGVRSVHHEGENIKTVPTTWGRAKNLNWISLTNNTRRLEKYISINLDLPTDLERFKNGG